MIDFEAICDQLGIRYWTSGKNNVEGCLTIRCPCCPDDDPDPSRHGNLDPRTGSYSCWRCKGSHPSVVIARAGHCSMQAAKDLIRKYTTGDSAQIRSEESKTASEIKLPGSSKPQDVHRKYLEGRGFDLDELEFYHGIRYTGMMEMWNGTNWGFRVVIPVNDYSGRLVSFQGRAIFPQQEPRYLFPPKELQVQDCKTLLYGSNLCHGNKTLVVTEGVMDAWKLGSGAVATFGIKVTREQILEMSRWRRVILAFDNEMAAIDSASEIAKELTTLGVEAYIANTDFGLNPDGSERDIGDLSIKDARALMRSLL